MFFSWGKLLWPINYYRDFYPNLLKRANYEVLSDIYSICFFVNILAHKTIYYI